MKKIYYAHSMHLYNSPQEKRDVQFLESLGYEVLNPNRPETQEGVEKWKKENGEDSVMSYFNSLIDECGNLAFRSHVDLKIPSGVGYEVKYANSWNYPVIELPTLTNARFLDVAETKLYLSLNGQR